MKRIAINACRELAGWIFDTGGLKSPLWPLADRIEKRFKIQDSTYCHWRELEQARNQFLVDERKKHNQLNPDRLTYLYR